MSLLRFNREASNNNNSTNNNSPLPPHQSSVPSTAMAVGSNSTTSQDLGGSETTQSGYFISPRDADGEAPFASAFSGTYEPIGDDADGGAAGNATSGSFAASADGSSPQPAIVGNPVGGAAVMKDYYKSSKFQQRRASTAPREPSLQVSPSLSHLQGRSFVAAPLASSPSFNQALFATKSQSYYGRGGLASGASEGGSVGIGSGFPSPQQQGGFLGGNTEEDSHLRMILEETEAQLSEARSNAEAAQFRVSFLEGEQSRLQHQIQTLKGDIKKLHADIFDLTSSKGHYSKQVDDLVEEKEELQMQLLSAGLVEKKAMQEMEVEMIQMQAQLERANGVMVKKDQLISNLLHENEKLKRGKTEQRESDSRHGDVQVRLHLAEKAKAVLQDKYEKEAAIVADRDSEIESLNAEIDQLNAAIERISKRTRRVGLGGAFAKSLNLDATNRSSSNNTSRRGGASLDASIRHRRGSRVGGGMEASLNGTIGGLNSTIAMLDEVEHEEEDYDEAVGKYLRVIRIDRALEGFKIEREGLQALLTEGMAVFQEVYNAHRVMQAIAYDDSKRAAQLMIKEEARLREMGPAASPYSNSRRQTPSSRRHLSPGRGVSGAPLQRLPPSNGDLVRSSSEPQPRSPESECVNISITSATARSVSASPQKSFASRDFELDPNPQLSPLQQRIINARGAGTAMSNSVLGASTQSQWGSGQQVPMGSSIRSTPPASFTPSAARSPHQSSLGAGAGVNTTAPPHSVLVTQSQSQQRAPSQRPPGDGDAHYLQYHHQGEACVGAHGKCYITSWYCANGKDMLEAWLSSINLMSPSLVNLLYNAGFIDMQAVSKMTERDMCDLQITQGIRRKLLAGVDALRDKLQVVTDETLRMLRNSYYLTDESYESFRRSTSLAGDALHDYHTDEEDAAPNRTLSEEQLTEKRRLRHLQRIARAREHLVSIQKRFSTQQRQLSLLSGTGFIPAFQSKEVEEELRAIPTQGISDTADPQEYNTKLVANEAPMVMDVMLQEVQSWFADIRLAIESQEGAVERILRSFDEEEAEPSNANSPLSDK